MAAMAAELAGPDDPVRATTIWMRGSWARHAGRTLLFVPVGAVLWLALGQWLPQQQGTLALDAALIAYLWIWRPRRTFVAVTRDLVLCYHVRSRLIGPPRGGTLALRAPLSEVTATREGFRRRVLRISAPGQPMQVLYLGLSPSEQAEILTAVGARRATRADAR